LGRKPENTLVLFGMDLLGSDFLGVVDDDTVVCSSDTLSLLPVRIKYWPE